MGNNTIDTSKISAYSCGLCCTGKTRTTNAIIDGLERIGIFSKCTGPTGVAAANYVGGQTAHSFFGMTKNTRFPMRTLSENQQKVVNRLGKATFVVFDEVSMSSTKLFTSMDTILQIALGNNKPFGGLSVILVGDFYQKPTTVGVPLNHTLYYNTMQMRQNQMDKAAATLLERFERWELNLVHRQKCETLTSILNGLRVDDNTTAWCILLETGVCCTLYPVTRHPIRGNRNVDSVHCGRYKVSPRLRVTRAETCLCGPWHRTDVSVCRCSP